jgi:hypothetical protein
MARFPASVLILFPIKPVHCLLPWFAKTLSRISALRSKRGSNWISIPQAKAWEKHNDTDFLCDGDCGFGLGGRCRVFAGRADRAASRRRHGGSQQCDAGSLASPMLARPLGPLALSIGVVVASVGRVFFTASNSAPSLSAPDRTSRRRNAP